MSLASQISDLATAVGASIKALVARVATLERGYTVTTLTVSSGVVTADLSAGEYFELLDLDANVDTFTLTNPPASGKSGIYGLLISQDETGGRMFALPASFHPIGNSDTAIQAAASAKTALIFWTLDEGTTYLYSMGKVA
jgi:hypothetical protein